MSKVSFISLWVYCIGWFIADGINWAAGWSYNFKTDFAVAIFILTAWVVERIWQLALSSQDRVAE